MNKIKTKYLLIGFLIASLISITLHYIISYYYGSSINKVFANNETTTIKKTLANKDFSINKITNYGYYKEIEEKTPPEKVTISAVGDILLDRGVEKKVKQYGFKFLLEDVREELMSSDITFANLENPVSFLGKPYYGKPDIVTFRADPSMLFCLKYADIDIVSLANNHAYDYYSEALTETMDFLDLLDIKYIGAGRDLYQARSPVIFDIKGYTIAFLGYTEAIWSTIQADKENSGIVHLDEKTVLDDILFTKAYHKPDYIILSIHWGIEQKNVPRSSDRELAHKFIDAGADIIFGHHPHVIQGIEMYKGGLIAYSLGNFAFDMSSSETYRSMILNITLSEGLILDTKIIPVKIVKKKYKPTIAKDKEAKQILDEICKYSQKVGSKVDILDEKYARISLVDKK
jgi:gamma-polyglutamate biosynthesis protein CapA